jgi:2'-5' RNA ligase
MVRAFIALPIPDAVKTAIERTQAQMQRGLPGKIARWTKREQFHLTLRFLGNVPADQITELADALRAVTSGFPALKLRAERVGCFPHPRFPRVLWVWVHDEAHQLPLLQQNIESAAGKFAESKADKEFTGHVTIARINGIKRQEAETLARQMTEMTHRLFGEWRATEVQLLRSELLQSGAVHTILATLPLQ